MQTKSGTNSRAGRVPKQCAFSSPPVLFHLVALLSATAIALRPLLSDSLIPREAAARSALGNPMHLPLPTSAREAQRTLPLLSRSRFCCHSALSNRGRSNCLPLRPHSSPPRDLHFFAKPPNLFRNPREVLLQQPPSVL